MLCFLLLLVVQLYHLVNRCAVHVQGWEGVGLKQPGEQGGDGRAGQGH